MKRMTVELWKPVVMSEAGLVSEPPMNLRVRSSDGSWSTVIRSAPSRPQMYTWP